MKAAPTVICPVTPYWVRASGIALCAHGLKTVASRPASGWDCAIVLAVCLMLSGAAAQELPAGVTAKTQLPAPAGVLTGQFTVAYPANVGKSQPAGGISATPVVLSSDPVTTPAGVRRITLEEAQQQGASGGANPMVRLGELQVEVARQNRLGTRSMYFPQIGSTFSNVHFNKFMGQQLQINRPLAGTTANFALPLAGKDQTLAGVMATQPITPLYQIHELYKIAKADENIARAKAGMSVSEKASNIEKAYYGLLVAQRQLALAKVQVRETENKFLLASNSAIAVGPAHDEEMIATSNAMAIATSKVKELTESLNELLGWSPETQLELVAPDPRFEDISLKEATEKALAANPEVVEASQNVVKARSAVKLQTWNYVPVIAAIGGYAYQNNVIPLLPRDFSYVGLIATYNVFDFGKREHTIKGAKAQREMAELALELTKAKVAASVKTSHLEVQRLQQLSQLTRRLASAIQVQQASYEQNNAEIIAAKKAKIEAEMFQADLDYREALGKLKTLMGQ